MTVNVQPQTVATVEITDAETVVIAEAIHDVLEVVTAGPQGPAQQAVPRSVTVSLPQAGDSFTIFRTIAQTTLTSISALVSNGSVTCQVRYAEDRATAGTAACVSTHITNTSTGQQLQPTNQPIPTGAYVWVDITAVDAPVQEFHVSLGL